MTPTDTRCPDCGSLVRPGMSWCTLCHADLRSDEEKEAASLESSFELVTSGASTAPIELASPLAAVEAAPVRGRHARPAAEPAQVANVAEAAPEAATETLAAASAAETDAKLAELREAGIDVDAMLQVLAADKGADPLTGFVNDRLGSKGSRAIAIMVASAALTSLGILLMWALGSLFG